MIKKTFALVTLLLIFTTLFGSYAYAGDFLNGSGSTGSGSTGFDVSIDRVRANGKVLAESRTNLLDDADVFSVLVDFTAVRALEKAHVEAILRGRQSSDTVADATATFDLARNTSSTVNLNLFLVNSMKSEPEFDLTIKIIDAKGRVEQKTYGISTEHNKARGVLDVSIDRVRVNDKIVAPSRTNFIDESDDFDVLVEFTALEDLDDAHVEAVLRDLRSGFVIADSSPNFDLEEDKSSSKLLKIELIDQLKDSDSFELTVRIVDTENDFVQKVYGISMKDGGSTGSRGSLDISIDSVEVEDDVIAEGESNFLVIGTNDKEIDLKVMMTSLEDIKDAHVDAVLSFESGDVVADATAIFDIAEDENIVKKLELSLNSRFEQADFRLKVRVVDAEGDFEEKVYGLKISRSNSQFLISSISVEPEDSLEAGKHALVMVNLRNSGLVSLDGLAVTAEIPELGISSVKFIDSIGTGEDISREFMLKVPDNTDTGTYTIRIQVSSQFSGMLDKRDMHVSVTGLADQQIRNIGDRLVINIPVVKQDIKNDGTEAVYQITLANEGSESKAYTLLLDGMEWADLRLSESNTFVLDAGSQKTISVFASTKEDISGEHAFIATVQTPEKVLKQVILKANVVDTDLGISLKTVLVVLLIIMALALVVASLIFIVRSLTQKDTSDEIPDELEGEAYY